MSGVAVGTTSASAGGRRAVTVGAVVGTVGVLLALLLLAGSLLDRDKEPGFGPPQPLPTLHAMAEHPMAGGRYRDPIAVAQVWPRADLILDEARCGAVDALRFRALAQANSVTTAPLPPFVVPDVPPLRSGSWSDHRWRIYAAEDPAGRGTDTLLVHCSPESGGTYEIVQSGLVDPDRASPRIHDRSPRDAWIGRLSRPSRSFARDVATDLIVLGGLTAIGGFLIPLRIRVAWARPALAMLVGMGLWSTLGLLLLPPWQAAPVALAIGGLLFARARRRGSPTGWSRPDLPPLAAFAAAVLVVVDFVRRGGWAVLHTDSFSYLLGGWAFASGSMERGLLSAERGLAQQALHGPAFLLGAEGLQSLSLVAFVAGIWLLASVALHRIPAAAFGPTAVVTVAAVLMLAMSPFMVRTAGLFNSHTLVAALLIGVVALWVATVDGDPDDDYALGIVAGVLLGTVVLLRAEGFLVVGSVLLGTLWDGTPRPRWRPAWTVSGAITVAWGVMVGGLSGILSGSASLQGLGLVAGGSLLLVAPLILGKTSVGARTMLPSLAIGGLWAAVGALLFAGRGRITVLEATRDNVLGSLGGWGLLGVSAMLLLLLALGQGFPKEFRQRLGPALTAVLAFFPVSVLSTQAFGFVRGGLSTALSGGARVNYFDSLNRMWVHVLLLTVLLAIARTAGSWRAVEPLPDGGGANALARVWPAVRTALVVLALFWVAAAWNPRYLASNVAGPVEQRSEQVLIEGAEPEVTQTLRPGETLAQELIPGGHVIRSEAPEQALCVRPLRDTGAEGDSQGAVLARLSVRIGPAEVANETVLVGDTHSLCVSLPTVTEPGLAIASASLELTATSDSGASVWTVSDIAGPSTPSALIERALGRSEPLDRALAVEASVVSSAGGPPGQWPRVTRTEAMVMRGLPAVAAVLITVLLLLRTDTPHGRLRRKRIPLRVRPLSIAPRVALALGTAGLLLGTVLLPTVMERATLATVTSGDWFGPLDADMMLGGSGRIVQDVDPRRLPRVEWLRSRDRLCAQVLVHGPDDGAGSGEYRIELVRGERFVATDPFGADVGAGTSQWVGGCFPLTARDLLDDGSGLRVVLAREGSDVGGGEAARVRLRSAGSGETPAVVLQDAASRATDGVLIHRFAVRQAPVEEFLWVALARSVSLAALVPLVFWIAAALGMGQRLGRLRERGADHLRVAVRGIRRRPDGEDMVARSSPMGTSDVMAEGSRRLRYDEEPGFRWSVRREGALLWFALWWKFALFGLFLVPMWDIPDETGHFAYVAALQEGSIGPFSRGDARMGEAVASLSAHREGTRNWIVQHPPAYYIFMAPLLGLFRLVGLDFTGQFFGLRLASASLAALGFAVVYVAARRIDVRAESALLAVVLLSIAPSATAVFSGVSNDGAVLLVAAVVVAALTRGLVPTTDPRYLVLTVVALGLGLATKAFFFVWIAGLAVVLVAMLLLRVLARRAVGLGLQTVALGVVSAVVVVVAPALLRGLSTAAPFSLVLDPPTNLLRVLVRQRSLSDFFTHYVGLIGWGGRGTMSFPNSAVLDGGFVVAAGAVFFVGVALVIRALSLGSDRRTPRLYSTIGVFAGSASLVGVALLLARGTVGHDRRIAGAAFVLLSLLLLQGILVAANGHSSSTRLIGGLVASAVVAVAATIVYISAPQILAPGYDPTVNIRASHGRYLFVVVPAALLAVAWSLDRIALERRILIALSGVALAWEVGVLANLVHPFYYGAG